MNSPSFSTIFPRGKFVENRWNFRFPLTPYRRGSGKLFHLVEETRVRRALLVCALRELPNVTLDSLPRQMLAQERAFVWTIVCGDWLRRCDAPGSHTCATDD